MPRPRYRLGTMGYDYTDWRGVLYREGTARHDWLGEYATHFDAVELNTTFHATPTVDRISSWCERVGPDFTFAVKTDRLITHDRPLSQGIDPMRAFVLAVRHFRHRLGPILIQLAPTVSIDAFNDLKRLLESLPNDLRFAVEFRHSSWIEDHVTDLLAANNVAWVGLDHLDHPAQKRLRSTSDFLYVRLVGRHNRFKELDHEQVDVEAELIKWHAAIEREIERRQGGVREVWLLANNDYAGHAPATLRRFARIANLEIGASPVQEELFASAGQRHPRETRSRNP